MGYLRVGGQTTAYFTVEEHALRYKSARRESIIFLDGHSLTLALTH